MRKLKKKQKKRQERGNRLRGLERMCVFVVCVGACVCVCFCEERQVWISYLPMAEDEFLRQTLLKKKVQTTWHFPSSLFLTLSLHVSLPLLCLFLWDEQNKTVHIGFKVVKHTFVYGTPSIRNPLPLPNTGVSWEQQQLQDMLEPGTKGITSLWQWAVFIIRAVFWVICNTGKIVAAN